MSLASLLSLGRKEEPKVEVAEPKAVPAPKSTALVVQVQSDELKLAQELAQAQDSVLAEDAEKQKVEEAKYKKMAMENAVKEAAERAKLAKVSSNPFSTGGCGEFKPGSWVCDKVHGSTPPPAGKSTLAIQSQLVQYPGEEYFAGDDGDGARSREPPRAIMGKGMPVDYGGFKGDGFGGYKGDAAGFGACKGAGYGSYPSDPYGGYKGFGPPGCGPPPQAAWYPPANSGWAPGCPPGPCGSWPMPQMPGPAAWCGAPPPAAWPQPAAWCGAPPAYGCGGGPAWGGCGGAYGPPGACGYGPCPGRPPF